jgi:hypothetical protein
MQHGLGWSQTALTGAYAVAIIVPGVTAIRSAADASISGQAVAWSVAVRSKSR